MFPECQLTVKREGSRTQMGPGAVKVVIFILKKKSLGHYFCLFCKILGRKACVCVSPAAWMNRAFSAELSVLVLSYDYVLNITLSAHFTPFIVGF